MMGGRDLLVSDVRCEMGTSFKVNTQKCHLLKILQCQWRDLKIFLFWAQLTAF